MGQQPKNFFSTMTDILEHVHINESSEWEEGKLDQVSRWHKHGKDIKNSCYIKKKP